jgi:type 1 fimbria pilin
MKLFNTLSLLTASVLIASTGFAQSSEYSRTIKLSGRIASQPDCVETGLSIKTKKKEICLGSNEFELAVGARYILGGELTEDGFFPSEFLN